MSCAHRRTDLLRFQRRSVIVGSLCAFLPVYICAKLTLGTEIAAFAARGWRVLCPDQLGYGQTDKPSDIEAYTFRSVAYDMNLLLDEVQVSGQVVVVGHDW